jgi:hypothetical protein
MVTWKGVQGTAPVIMPNYAGRRVTFKGSLDAPALLPRRHLPGQLRSA